MAVLSFNSNVANNCHSAWVGGAVEDTEERSVMYEWEEGLSEVAGGGGGGGGFSRVKLHGCGQGGVRGASCG